jgi:hypothetical protein
MKTPGRIDSSTILGWAIGVGAAAKIALHVLEPPLAITWSYGHLNRYPAMGWVALLLATLLPFLTARLERLPGAARPSAILRAPELLGLAAALSGIFLLVGWFFPSKAVSLDASAFAVEVWKGDVSTHRWYLTITTFSALHKGAEALSGVAIPARDFVSVANTALCGLAFALILGSASLLTRTRFECATLTLLSWTALGNLQLALYYMDIYPLVQLALAAFLFSGLRTIERDGHPIWPTLVGTVGLFFYQGLVLLLPALLLLLCAALRRPAGGRRVAVACAAALFLCAMATIPGYGAPLAFGPLLADLALDPTRPLGLSAESNFLPFSYLWSPVHLREFLHTFLLIDGVGSLLCLTTGGILTARILRGDFLSSAAVVLVLAATVVGYAFVMDPLWGAYRDWDLFSYAAVPTSLFGGYSFVAWCRAHPQWRGPLSGLLLAASLVHLAARLNAIELEAERHTEESPMHLQFPEPETSPTQATATQ